MREARLEGLDNGLFRLRGNMSFGSVTDLWRQSQLLFRSIEAASLEIDLRDVNHVDSAGLALVVAWTRLSHRNAKALRFTHIPPKLLALAKANNLDDLLEPDLH